MIKTRSLPVRLTREEREVRSAQLAEAISKHDQVDGEKKAAMSGYKVKLDELNAEIRKLGTAVRTNIEDRDVEIEEKPTADFMMRIYRTDTGELVDTRSMTDGERDRFQQAALFGERHVEADPKAKH